METFGRIVREHWEPWQDRLPLHFCSLMTLVCFIALWFRKPWACAVAYFGVLTASVQGLITPMLYDGFPSAAFFAFFVGHGLLLISALYLPVVLGWRARPWDDVKTLGLCDAYLLLIIPVNVWLGTNYGFTRYAPAGTVLEYFGPAPWYLLTLQLPALAILRLLYLTVRSEEIKNLLCGNDDCCGNGVKIRPLRFGAAWRFSTSRLCGWSSPIILPVRQIRYFSVFRSSFVNRWISFSRAWRIFPPIPHPPAGRGLRQSGQFPAFSRSTRGSTLAVSASGPPSKAFVKSPLSPTEPTEIVGFPVSFLVHPARLRRESSTPVPKPACGTVKDIHARIRQRSQKSFQFHGVYASLAS
ncbi:MAG: TIGR02206 family membrane protein [Akkermansia sp.]